MATLTDRLGEFIAAAFTGIWIQTCEPDDALTEIATLCRKKKWPLAVWDIDRGLHLPIGSSGEPAATPTTDPLAAIKAAGALARPDQPDGSALLVMLSLHRFLGSAEIVQALAHQITTGKQNRTFVVVLSPVVNIPIELEKSFVVIEHDLPGREQLVKIARGVATEKGELPDGESLEKVLDAAAGLTRVEAEGAFALSLVRQAKVTPEAIWELKTGMLKKSGLLTLHRGSERFADLGGLDALKQFCTKALSNHRPDGSVRARGILLLSPPGCGKSSFAKALGNEMGRPTLVLDVGSLMGSLVGATEENTRRALRIVDAMAPAVCFLDEVDKALSGVQSSGQTDSGVSARLFGSMLSWLNDHESDVFVVMTCNDVSKLPPEFSRAERFDGVFFVDLPSAAERAAIWRLYLAKFKIAQQKLPADTDWTGAEIRACCRLSKLMDVPLVEAATNIVPVAVTAAESVARLRSWASGRCLSAYRPGIYQHSQVSSAPVASGGRNVSRQGRN